MITISAPALYNTQPVSPTATPGPVAYRPQAPVDQPVDTVHISLAATRELLQFSRVLAGQKNGTLSSSEVQQLGSQLKDLNSQISAAKNGGPISNTQKQDINQLQNQISKEIYGYAHGNLVQGAPVPVPPVSATP